MEVISSQYRVIKARVVGVDQVSPGTCNGVKQLGVAVDPAAYLYCDRDLHLAHLRLYFGAITKEYGRETVLKAFGE